MIFDDGDGRVESSRTVAEFATSAGLLRVEYTWQTITWEDGPDERWRYTDRAGHVHAYQKPAVPAEMTRPRRRRKGRKTVLEHTNYPTLRYVVDREHHCHGGEGLYVHEPHWVTDEAHYECRQCQERIRPGHGPGAARRLTGRTATLTETMDTPPAPLAADSADWRVTYKRGRVSVTRTRVLSKDEAEQMIALAAREDVQRGRDKDARRVEQSLGYPPGFNEGR